MPEAPKTAAEQKPTATVVKHKPKLHQDWMQEGDFARRVWHIELPAQASKDMITDPHAWAHLSRKLRKKDRLEIWTADMSWFADAVVREVRGLLVVVAIVHEKSFAVAATPVEAGYTASPDQLPRIEFRGPIHQWCVRGLDESIIATGFATEEAARPAFDQYKATLAMATPR